MSDCSLVDSLLSGFSLSSGQGGGPLPFLVAFMKRRRVTD